MLERDSRSGRRKPGRATSNLPEGPAVVNVRRALGPSCLRGATDAFVGLFPQRRRGVARAAVDCGLLSANPARRPKCGR